MFNNTYKNKKVLITGHTGFKGSWLSLWLNQLGARVYGISNTIPTNPSNYEVSGISKIVKSYYFDINDQKRLNKTINTIKPDFVFHLAAQALVKNSYSEPIKTIYTNALGTSKLLDSIRNLKKRVSTIIITSDKVYLNKEINRGYKENDLIGGNDPYSASKGMAELAIKSYFVSYIKKDNSKKLAVTRAGNVIGGGDWAKDRIVPDCVRAWSRKESALIRNLNATRPWQHVLEPLSGYLLLGLELNRKNKINGQAYNFGPHSKQNKTVSELINEMSKYWNEVKWKKENITKKNHHEAGLLRLNCKKAESHLGWKPNLNFTETVSFTISWYKEFYSNNNLSMREYCLSQINEYCKIAKKNKLVWTK